MLEDLATLPPSGAWGIIAAILLAIATAWWITRARRRIPVIGVCEARGSHRFCSCPGCKLGRAWCHDCRVFYKYFDGPAA